MLELLHGWIGLAVVNELVGFAYPRGLQHIDQGPVGIHGLSKYGLCVCLGRLLNARSHA